MKDYEFYYTQDGSIGLYSYVNEDVYHSKYGALTEAWEKFILPSGLDELINTKEKINVLDVCYGVGYNTKALMSYVINKDEKLLTPKNIFISIFFNIKKFFILKILKKIISLLSNIESIYSNNIYKKAKRLLISFESECRDKTISKFDIDCLEIEDELVKLSPFLKTVFTPQEIYTKIVPRFLDCFDTYWIIRNKLSKFTLKIALKNTKNITELLNLKYNNDFDLLNSNYKIHKYVNYVLINSILDKYKDNYFDKEFNLKLKNKINRRFYDKSKIKYAKFMQSFRYNPIQKFNFFAFLHNIYYRYFSIRYKKIKFKHVESLFKLRFMTEDARKSILNINRQYDLMFLDAFTYSKAPELWTVEFIAELYRRLSPRGILITYSTSAQVRNTFLENNFYLGKIVDKKTGKCIGTIAAKDKAMIKIPLSNYEIGLCNTRAGIPYHDSALCADRDYILSHREYEFKNSDLPTSTQYMRSRLSRKEDTDDE